MNKRTLGERDIYNQRDFDRTPILEQCTRVVARKATSREVK